VVHDELDLQPGVIRLKQGGGNGGHNGLKDIQAHLTTPDFWRLRLGIGHPGERDAVVGYVLKAPRREEQELIDRAIDRCLLAWPELAAGDYAAAQRLLHVKSVSPIGTDERHHESPMRYRRSAQRRQVHPLQCPDQGRRIAAENYPFCTIEPNVGIVEVPDPRLAQLAAIVKPQRVQPAVVEFVDIAGLVAGASKGEGLGNKFLANIRETDAIVSVVRCFEDDNVVHVSGRVDPLIRHRNDR
jgi:hypothetical protein